MAKTSEPSKEPAKPVSIVDMLFKSGVVNVSSILRQYERGKNNRRTWDSRWQMIQDQVFPNFRDYVGSPKVGYASQPRTDQIKNHSSVVSGKINKIVSQINAQLTDPSVKWMNLEFVDPCYLANGYPIMLSKISAAKNWLYAGKTALYNLFSDPSSNFYPSTYEFQFDWFTIGTSCREIILRKDNNRIRFNTVSMQNIYIELSGYGEISTIYRTFLLSPRQAYDLWGDKIHESEKRQMGNSDSTDSTKMHEYVEASMPNPLANQLPSAPYVTCVIDKRNQYIVDMELHNQHKYGIARFNVAPGEIYGRSFVWTAMPDIKIVNRLSKRAVQSADYAVAPPILVRDATSIVQSQLAPNTFVQGLDSRGVPTMQPMNLSAGFPFLMEYYQAKLNDLDEALVARDIFSPEVNGMTATEVNERKIQASNRLRPMLIRLEQEDLNKTVVRTLSLLSQTGIIPPFPYEELQLPPELLPDPFTQIRFRFSGQMARMQRLQEIQNSDMLFNKALQAAQVDNSVLDRINLDQLIVQDAEIYDVNPAVINSEETVQQIRQQRAEQQQEQMQTQILSSTMDNMIKAKEAGFEI
jgi:hypothetical protein